jgi:outer membrane protein assembly factor BamD (BamD/ComL family)
MRLIRYIFKTISFLFLFLMLASPVFSQQGLTLDVKKPKEFENRVLRSEKSDQKKFSGPKRFIQNTITHYNYFFNANNKLNEVLDRAKLAFVDDYSTLIPFYNYSLETTAADSIQLDSISYKAQTGIVLHDLRTDWADNLYLLWGASYYFKQQFDSAHLMFQFINQAFAEKEKDGYYRTIGSARDGNSAMAISTKEKSSLTHRMFSEPPSRNDAFIWQIRNYLERNRFSEAASLVQALKNDPQFPKRLENDLEEVQAYSFYKQQLWDSSAAHLEKALSVAATKHERARWEFLLGQLYERTGRDSLAEKWYGSSINHTTDPIMDVYARLATVRVTKNDSEDAIEKNIATLVKMAKRDKYVDYRDIIYFMAAQMELERNNTDNAIPLLLRSTKYAANNPSQRNKAFLQLAELSFQKRRYRDSYNFYDSLQLGDPSIKDPENITARKEMLARLTSYIGVVERQDSMQLVAAMPVEERRAFIKKLVRRLRKEQGLKEEATSTAAIDFPSKQQQAPSLFNDNKKGEWYFYNKAAKQKGSADFERRWGKRNNIDNWRRSALANAGAPRRADQDRIDRENAAQAKAAEDREVTFESLHEKLPLTPESLQVSNDSIQAALYDMGTMYVKELEDCAAASETFEALRKRFPQHPEMEQVLFNLYYCAGKQNDLAKADSLKKLMNDQFAGSKLTKIVTTGRDQEEEDRIKKATKTYEDIYDLFIEGKFSEALQQKKLADSIYGKNHWTPQLLYIEAVYHIKQRQDTAAIAVLYQIMSQFEGTVLAEKADNLAQVLSRRSQIEEELRNMVINMPAEDSRERQSEIITANKPVTTVKPVTRDPLSGKTLPPPVVSAKPGMDTIAVKPVVQEPVVKITPDTTSRQPVAPPASPEGYAYEAGAPHYVLIVLNKVDPIFVNEAKNAFVRYNRDTYYNKQMQAALIELDSDNRLLLISPFKDAADALAYVDQTRPRTASEILPWLKGGKYSYSILTEKNLEVLKKTKDFEKYRQFLDKNLPGKF